MGIEFKLQEIMALFLGIFLLAEILIAVWKLTRHGGALHLSKYVFTTFVSVWLCVNALMGEIDWLEIAEAAALSAFVARRLLWRLGHHKPLPEDARA